jgi:hypothetical protein
MTPEILVDDEGREFRRPRREDFEDVEGYARAFWAYRDAIAACANGAFDEAFRAEMKKGRMRRCTST